jgi:hypothetical protein
MNNTEAKSIEVIEKRSSPRFEHTSPLQIKEIQAGTLHKAKMFNYSKEGLYFESDSRLKKGMQIYIGIKNSPYVTQPDVLAYHRGVIQWYRELEDSFFTYGYGVRLLTIINRNRHNRECDISSTSVMKYAHGDQ